MILKNKDGEVHLIWYLFLLVVPFLLAAYLLRYIPIRIQMIILLNRGVSELDALSRARYTFLEDPIGVSAAGILQGLLWYVLVWLLIRTVEKRRCTLKSFGLTLNSKQIVFVVLGFLLGLMMYFSYFGIGTVFEQSPFRWRSTRPGMLVIILIVLDMFANGFGEESAFRAYWQRLLIDRHGQGAGIILASISFVLLHLLITPFTGTALLASILLACLYGVLYVWTESIFLVGIMHAMFNLMPRLSNQWPSDISLLIVNGFALMLAVVLYFRFGKANRVQVV